MRKILFISLGCDKNLVDSEVMLGLLHKAGFALTDDEREADVIVVNSCCFIGDAKEESINTILDMARYKEIGVCKALVVTGCLAERYKEEVLTEMPEVDAVVGTSSYDHIVEVVQSVLRSIISIRRLLRASISLQRVIGEPSGGDNRRALCFPEDCGRL